MTPLPRAARRAAVAFAAVVAVTGPLAGCTGATPYAAIVNGTRVSQSELLRQLSGIAGNKAYVAQNLQQIQQAASAGQTAPPTIFNPGETNTVSQAFAAIVLNTDIDAAVVHSELARRHALPAAKDITAAKTTTATEFGTDPAVFNAFTPWFQHVFEEQTADAIAFAKVLGPVDSSRVAVQKFYNDNPADFITSECVSHILVASQSLAVSIRAKIAAGADFAAMAKQYSTDTSSAVKGGDLGCNAPGGYVPPFEHVADSIKVGVVSQPVQSQFGWHVIKVTSRQTHSLDLATAVQIQQYLQQLNPVTAFLQANQPKVHVNPAYGSWDPTQHVVPPTPPAANSGVPTTTAAPSALTP